MDKMDVLGFTNTTFLYGVSKDTTYIYMLPAKTITQRVDNYINHYASQNAPENKLHSEKRMLYTIVEQMYNSVLHCFTLVVTSVILPLYNICNETFYTAMLNTMYITVIQVCITYANHV